MFRTTTGFCSPALRKATGLAALAAVLATILGWGTTVLAGEYEARVFTNASGATLPYRLLSPKNYNPAQKYPLVLFLHGAGERGADNKAQLVHGTGLYATRENQEKFPCFVLAPQCPAEKQWVNMNWSADSGVRPAEPSAPMLLALSALDGVIKEFSIDTNRIYVTGLSMGGYGTWDCITRFPTRFAAGAPVCGGGDESTVTPEVAKTPVWAFHSADDSVVRVGRTRNMIQAFRKAGGHPHYFEYSGMGHNSWSAAYSEPEFLPWLFAQRLGQPDRYLLKTKEPAAQAPKN